MKEYIRVRQHIHKGSLSHLLKTNGIPCHHLPISTKRSTHGLRVTWMGKKYSVNIVDVFTCNDYHVYDFPEQLSSLIVYLGLGA